MKTTHAMTYVWQFPVRFYHWVNAICIGVLFFTGIYIGMPFFRPLNTAGDATISFFMGYMIYIHMAAAYIFTFNFLFRCYWAIVGNLYSRHRFNPWTPYFWTSLWHTMRYYLFLEDGEEEYLGHNPLAELAYFFFVMVGSMFMIVTGFVLYAAIHPESALFAWFSWAAPLLGGAPYTRVFHHLAAWGFIVFFVTHLYLVLRHDVLAKDGTLSSIVTGWKFTSNKRA